MEQNDDPTISLGQRKLKNFPCIIEGGPIPNRSLTFYPDLEIDFSGTYSQLGRPKMPMKMGKAHQRASLVWKTFTNRMF